MILTCARCPVQVCAASNAMQRAFEFGWSRIAGRYYCRNCAPFAEDRLRSSSTADVSAAASGASGEAA